MEGLYSSQLPAIHTGISLHCSWVGGFVDCLHGACGLIQPLLELLHQPLLDIHLLGEVGLRSSLLLQELLEPLALRLLVQHATPQLTA